MSDDHSWVNQSGEVVHPNAPVGGGGPGGFKHPRALGSEHHHPPSTVPDPNSPAGRQHVLDEKQKEKIKRGAAPKTASKPAPKWKDDDALNEKVKAEADGYVGKPIVGDGECYALVDKLLPEAGAKSAPQFMPKITPDGDYIWGRPIDLKDIKPGDVLQLRNHKIVISTVTTKKKIDPDTHHVLTEEKGGKIEEYHRGHHTSVVSSIDGGGILTVVEQHVLDPATKGGNKETLSTVVRRNTLYLYSSTKTLPKKVATSLHAIVEEETTVKITVSGKVWAYRPQATGP